MTKMKGLFKGIKFISQIFVYKEHEMEIGYPTDVKHVAHIGWDNNAPGNSPSWMNEFKNASDFSSTSVANFGQSKESPWATKDFDQPRDLRPSSGAFADPPCSDKPKTPKKTKQKKIKASSPTASSISPKSLQARGFHGRPPSDDTMELKNKFK